MIFRENPPPRLRRAVAEATEPFGPEASGGVTALNGDLAEFLSDRRTADATYETIVR